MVTTRRLWLPRTSYVLYRLRLRAFSDSLQSCHPSSFHSGDVRFDSTRPAPDHSNSGAVDGDKGSSTTTAEIVQLTGTNSFPVPLSPASGRELRTQDAGVFNDSARNPPHSEGSAEDWIRPGIRTQGPTGAAIATGRVIADLASASASGRGLTPDFSRSRRRPIAAPSGRCATA